MIEKARELTIEEKADAYDAILKQTIKWSNCPLEEVEWHKYQGRCGRIGWDVRNILYHMGAIEAVKDDMWGRLQKVH